MSTIGLQNETELQIDADEVIDRLKQTVGVNSDIELSEALGVNKSTVSTWRSRKRIPYPEVVRVALETRQNIDWILTGRERNEIIPGVFDGPFDVKILSAALYDVWESKIFQQAIDGNDWQKAAFRSKWIVQRYNHFLYLMGDMTKDERMSEKDFTNFLLGALGIDENGVPTREPHQKDK